MREGFCVSWPSCRSLMLKIDSHTHILPRVMPKWSEKFGYEGFVHLEDSRPGFANMMKDGGFFREIGSNCSRPSSGTKQRTEVHQILGNADHPYRSCKATSMLEVERHRIPKIAPGQSFRDTKLLPRDQARERTHSQCQTNLSIHIERT